MRRALLAALLLAAPLAAAESAAPALAEEPALLLDRRLFLRLPAGAQVSPGQAVPGCVEPGAYASWTAGDRRVNVAVTECFELCEEDFPAAAERAVARLAGQGQIRFVCRRIGARPGGSPGMMLVPDRIVPTGEGEDGLALVRAAFVLGADKAVRFLQIFADPALARNETVSVPLAEAICASAAPGPASLPLAGGRISLPLPSGRPLLSLLLPPGILAIPTGLSEEGRLFHIRRPGVFGGEGESGILGIYFGRNVTAFHEKYAGRKAEVEAALEGRLLGRSARWYAWRLPEDPPAMRRLESAVPEPAAGEGAAVHAFIAAPDEKQLAELRTVAESLAGPSAPTEPELK